MSAYAIGLDVGSGSLGWSVIGLDTLGTPCSVVDAGVELFSTSRVAKNHMSLASVRTQARQSRRQLERSKRRVRNTVSALVRAGFINADRTGHQSSHVNPYEVRYRAVSEMVTLDELAQAFIHMSRYRGFKSGARLVSSEEQKEDGVIRSAVSATKGRLLDSGMTRGQDMYVMMLNEPAVPVRRRTSGGRIPSNDNFTSREMILDEFEVLWDAQAKLRREVGDDDAKLFSYANYLRIHRAIFFQRPLKDVSPGRCHLERDELRAPKALQSSQNFILFSWLNNIRIFLNNDGEDADVARPLSRSERSKALEVLRPGKSSVKKVTMDELFVHVWGRHDIRTTCVDKNALMDSTWAVMSHKYPDWASYEVKYQDALVKRYMEKKSYGHDLSEGYVSQSAKASLRILEFLMGWDEEKDAPYGYYESMLEAGYRVDKGHEELLDRLPYYGKVLESSVEPVPGRDNERNKSRFNKDEWKFGRVSNVTVHVSLNKMRKVVNRIIDDMGGELPTYINVETTRDLAWGQKKINDYNKETALNRKRNETLTARVSRDFNGRVASRQDLVRVRLYDDLVARSKEKEARCVITNEVIDYRNLFEDYEVDHILPFSRTMDDSYGNKVLITRSANASKSNLAPYEAYGSTPEWKKISARAKKFYGSSSPQARKFTKSAVESMKENKFVERQLNDTAYISRIAREYLSVLNGEDSVRGIPGRITSDARYAWDVNTLLNGTDNRGKKNREDHRHHALDAIVVGCVSPRMVAQAHRRSTRMPISSKGFNAEQWEEIIPLPWLSFRSEVGKTLEGIEPSYTVKRTPHGEILEATNYSPVRDDNGVVILDADGFASFTRVQKNGSVISQKCIPVGITSPRGQDFLYKVNSGNFCYEVYLDEKGNRVYSPISNYVAHSSSFQSFMNSANYQTASYNGHVLVARVFINSIIEVEHEGKTQKFRVRSIGRTINDGKIDSIYRTSPQKEQIKMSKKKLESLVVMEEVH